LFAAVTVYRVDPVRTRWSAWAKHGDTLSQALTCNFDSLSCIELFCGDDVTAGVYSVEVRDSVTERLIARKLGATPSRGHTWLRFEPIEILGASAKGSLLSVNFTGGEKDSIQYYYDGSDQYRHGETLVDTKRGPSDLCMRVYGRMKSIDSTYWTMDPGQPVCWWTNDWALRDTWIARLDSSGVGAIRFEISWPEIQPGSLDSYDFANLDTNLLLLRKAGCGAFVLFDLCAKAASTSFDTVADTWRIRCPPRGLYDSVDSSSNSWARFLNTILKHSDSVLEPRHRLHAWEIWNEPNDTVQYWARPNRRDYTTGYAGLPGMCSLYVRLCEVAATVIRGTTGHEGDTILVGSMAGMEWSDPWVKGRDWIRTVYYIASGNVPWTGVSLHPYQGSGEFDPDFYEENCDTVRAIMGNKVGTIWNTEIGWDTLDHSPASEELNARNLCKAYVTSRASEARPQGGYDRVNWWQFRERFGHGFGRCGYYPLWDSAMTDAYMSFYACRQMTKTLTGKRFNRRVMAGDTAGDNHTRMYEFEDTTALQKRTWVCWEDGNMKKNIRVKLPVRTDQLTAESLAYSSMTPSFTPRVGSDGWVTLDLNTRPVFIHEVGPADRPDLRVDSVRFDPASRVVKAWATNHGTRATPNRSRTRKAYPTWAVLRSEGDSVAQAVWTQSIAMNQGAEFRFELGKTVLPDTALLSVAINPKQIFVELETDDNTGYTLKVGP
jgi:hypothetical protein